jgi:hypothetical protein
MLRRGGGSSRLGWKGEKAKGTATLLAAACREIDVVAKEICRGKRSQMRLLLCAVASLNPSARWRWARMGKLCAQCFPRREDPGKATQ